MATKLESAPVKTVQLEGKIIAITGANRGTQAFNALPIKHHINSSIQPFPFILKS
jgi:hypothetical protein